MTRRRLEWILLAFVICSTPVRAQDSLPPLGRFVLRGQVRDSTHRPIASAVVRMFGSRRSTTTDRNGKFTLTGLPDRTRVFEILALGYTGRLLRVSMSDDMPAVTVVLARSPITLDSVQIEARTASMTSPTATDDKISRRGDRILERELAAPDVIGGNALEAFALLRPRLFLGRPSGGLGATTEAARRGQFFPRDEPSTMPGAKGACVGNRACDIDGRLSVSVDEGPLGSPDVLTSLSVRHVSEMRYLAPVEATARFGMAAGGGPVLVVYTK